MAKYGKKTKLKTIEVMNKAIEFFGKKGQGLKITEQTDQRVCFEGGGGHVTVVACETEETEIEIETREWDYQVKKFLGKI